MGFLKVGFVEKYGMAFRKICSMPKFLSLHINIHAYSNYKLIMYEYVKNGLEMSLPTVPFTGLINMAPSR